VFLVFVARYATRFFGDAAPFADIKSINFWGCVFLPPLVSSWTSGMDDMAVMLPGLWLFSLASIPLLYYDALWAVRGLLLAAKSPRPPLLFWFSKLVFCSFFGV
jgi:hypothetical protein